MAKADTYKGKTGGFNYADKCVLCDKKPVSRAFYYPTYFNGDAEWLGDLCEDHKGTDLTKLSAIDE